MRCLQAAGRQTIKTISKIRTTAPAAPSTAAIMVQFGCKYTVDVDAPANTKAVVDEGWMEPLGQDTPPCMTSMYMRIWLLLLS